MSDEPKSAIERAIEYGIDITLLEASLRLTPTERVRKGEAFSRFAWEVREQGRRHREKQEEHGSNAVRDDPDQAAG
jgi:hypothetical protein